MKILHLIDAFDLDGSARQLRALAPGLANDATSLEICSLGPDASWTSELRRAGVAVHALNWTRWVDPGVLWNLRAQLRQVRPDVIHVWNLSALRALALVAKGLLPRTVVSAPLPLRGVLAWWDRWLLRQTRCLAVAGLNDQECWERQGIARPTLRVVPPAVPEPERQRSIADEFAGAPARIVCAGKLERETGMRFAIWAFDMVHYPFPDTCLQIVGAGSLEQNLRDLAHGLDNGAQFLGPCDDVTAALKDAALVWIPSIANCGRQIAMEAMSLGKPVIASDVPCLRDVIRDGETGFLVPPGDVVELARRTRTLLLDEALCDRLGDAARQSVRERFGVADAVLRWREVYRTALSPLAA